MARSTEVAKGVDVPKVWYHDWVKDNVPDMTGKVVVVTGANSGTGFWCAAALAGQDAEVVLACRSLEKAEVAKADILEMHPGKTLSVMALDNMDLDSVRAFPSEFVKKYDKLHLLVNNAGIMAQNELQSKDGHDVQFQTNHLAHFLLTHLLWDKLMAASAADPSQPARVVHHSSGAHWMGYPKFDRNQMSVPHTGIGMWWFWWIMCPLNGMPQEPWKRYTMSKLCNCLFGLELQRKIEAANLQNRVISVMCHPGWASTQLQVQRNAAKQPASFLAFRLRRWVLPACVWYCLFYIARRCHRISSRNLCDSG
eukprot:TRINITY_DN11313_c0_g1_i4.p1 TRINITY_DN11313_c0_g1~~TRINITY_DN11313_c0_g1_i4.p1  ORF type:complete len:310 (-),score=50.72 TRINITY_DN11313_c0_g1_i4:24-953(-)